MIHRIWFCIGNDLSANDVDRRTGHELVDILSNDRHQTLACFHPLPSHMRSQNDIGHRIERIISGRWFLFLNIKACTSN